MKTFQELPEKRFIRYNGTSIPLVGGHNHGSLWLIGEQFGYRCAVFAHNLQDAFEIANQHGVATGEPVDNHDLALDDYDGETFDDRVESAMNDGDISSVDTIGPCWNDHYAVFREVELSN